MVLWTNNTSNPKPHIAVVVAGPPSQSEWVNARPGAKDIGDGLPIPRCYVAIFAHQPGHRLPAAGSHPSLITPVLSARFTGGLAGFCRGVGAIRFSKIGINQMVLIY